MIDNITTDLEDGMKKAIMLFERNIQRTRTDRANHAMLDGINVDYYGVATPVNQIASVQVVDARLMTIKPWERSMLQAICQAIRESALGINPIVDSDCVRLPIPPLTQERRRDLVKSLNKQTEEARVAVRAGRRAAMDTIRSMEKAKLLSEDGRKLGEKKIQDLTDRYVAVVDDIAKNKEKEIMGDAQ